MNTPIEKSFPLAARYSDILQPAGRIIRESGSGMEPYTHTERHIQCIWFDPELRPATLKSHQGETIVVDDPGRWNLESGPDFLDCTLTVGPDRRKIRGDVEVHIHPSDWDTHSHSANKAYNRVIAHVTYFPGTVPLHALQAGAQQISLRDALKANRAFSFDSIDVTAYPYSIPSDSPPCSLAMKDSPDTWNALLDSAGQERLRRKSAMMAAVMKEAGRDQTLYTEILTALGYKNNRAAMRQLASLVPLEMLTGTCGTDTVKAYSILLGAAGLLPLQASAKWDGDTRKFIRSLWDQWWKHNSKWEGRIMPKASWRLSGIRPANHPLRRLAAAASIACNLPALRNALRPGQKETGADWYDRATGLLENYSRLEFWNNRLSLGTSAGRKNMALIGAGRISAIITNVIIPYLAAEGFAVDNLLRDMPPEDDNSITRQTAYWLFGRDHNPAFYNCGLRQQGLIQIFHDFCLRNRSSCRNCELPDAINRHFK